MSSSSRQQEAVVVVVPNEKEQLRIQRLIQKKVSNGILSLRGVGIRDEEIPIVIQELLNTTTTTTTTTFKGIHYLSFASNKIRFQGWKQLSDTIFPRNTLSTRYIKRLDLCNNDINDKSIQIIVHGLIHPYKSTNLNSTTTNTTTCTPRLPLTSFYVGRNNITNAGCPSLCKLMRVYNSSLKYLFLWKNNIGTHGCQLLLKELETNTCIVDLELRHNPKHVSNQVQQEQQAQKRIIHSIRFFTNLNKIGKRDRHSLFEASKKCYHPNTTTATNSRDSFFENVIQFCNQVDMQYPSSSSSSFRASSNNSTTSSYHLSCFFYCLRLRPDLLLFYDDDDDDDENDTTANKNNRQKRKIRTRTSNRKVKKRRIQIIRKKKRMNQNQATIVILI